MPATTYGQHTAAALGTFATLLVADPAVLDVARDLLAAELTAIDAACSRFRPDSELIRACAAGGRPVPVSPLFAEALSVALTAAELTGGDVDPTCGRALAGLGYDRDFAAARQDTGSPCQPPVPGGGWHGVVLDASRHEVTVPSDVLLDLGATAKALAADRAAAAITAATGCGVLVNLGGDISVAGEPPEGGWLVGVADNATFDTTTVSVETSQVIVIRDGGLATSSVLGRAWQRGGTQLHHITVRLSHRAGGGAWLVVADNGPGFPPGGPVRRGLSGGDSTGLGLDIARRVAEASGGTMTIGRSMAGGGSVTLGLGPPAGLPAKRRHRRSGLLRR